MLLLIDVSCLVSFDTLHFLVQSGSLRQLEDFSSGYLLIGPIVIAQLESFRLLNSNGTLLIQPEVRIYSPDLKVYLITK